MQGEGQLGRSQAGKVLEEVRIHRLLAPSIGWLELRVIGFLTVLRV